MLQRINDCLLLVGKKKTKFESISNMKYLCHTGVLVPVTFDNKCDFYNVWVPKLHVSGCLYPQIPQWFDDGMVTGVLYIPSGPLSYRAASPSKDQGALMMSMSSLGGDSLQDIWQMLDEEGVSPRPFTPQHSGNGMTLNNHYY